MRRYFLVADADMPGPADNVGHWHAIHLGSHGRAGSGHNLVVLMDDHVPPPPAWAHFPRMTDAKTALRDRIDHRLLADIGLTGAETMHDAAGRLAAIHPLMGH